MGENVIKTKSFHFALHVMGLYKRMVAQKEYVISKQLLRSGTSIGANVQEGLAAQTRKDFLFKMTLASKEASETLYWLELLKESGWLKEDLTHSQELAKELVRILTAIVKTSGITKSIKI